MITTNIAFARAKHLVCETFITKAVDGVNVRDFIWECPLGVTQVEVELWGAGGHGGNSAFSSDEATGGRAGQKLVQTVDVVQGEEYPIHIGMAARKKSENSGNGEASTAFSLVAQGGECGKKMSENPEYTQCYGEAGYQLGGYTSNDDGVLHAPVTNGGIAAGGHGEVQNSSDSSYHSSTMGGDGICIIRYYI